MTSCNTEIEVTKALFQMELAGLQYGKYAQFIYFEICRNKVIILQIEVTKTIFQIELIPVAATLWPVPSVWTTAKSFFPTLALMVSEIYKLSNELLNIVSSWWQIEIQQ